MVVLRSPRLPEKATARGQEYASDFAERLEAAVHWCLSSDL